MKINPYIYLYIYQVFGFFLLMYENKWGDIHEKYIQINLENYDIYFNILKTK